MRLEAARHRPGVISPWSSRRVAAPPLPPPASGLAFDVANVMSTIAIFLALGGDSVAAVSSSEDPSDPECPGAGERARRQRRARRQCPDDGAGEGNEAEDGRGEDEGRGDGDAIPQTATKAIRRRSDSSAGGLTNLTTRESSPVAIDADSDEVVASTSCQSGEQVVGGGSAARRWVNMPNRSWSPARRMGTGGALRSKTTPGWTACA